MRTQIGVEDGPIRSRSLPQHRRHLQLGIGLPIPDKPFTLGVDPDSETVESVHAAPAGRVARVHQARRVKQLVIQPIKGCAGLFGQFQPAALRVDPRTQQHSRVAGQCREVSRPISPDQFQVGFETARGQDHELRPNLFPLATALIHHPHSHHPPGLDHQRGGLRVPYEGEIRIPQTLPVNRAHQTHPASFGHVLPPHAVSGDHLRIQLPIAEAKVAQPVVHFPPGILRVEADPVSIGILAKPNEVPASQLNRIGDMIRDLLGRSDQAHHPAGHHRVPAED